MSFLNGDYELEESQQLEFKEASAGLPIDTWETYSAFANTEGGEIVFGVREDTDPKSFTLVGVNDPTESKMLSGATLETPRRSSATSCSQMVSPLFTGTVSTLL